MILKGNKTSEWNEILLGFLGILTLQDLDLFTVPWFESHIKKFWAEGNGWNSLNVFDNAIIRSTRYWTWNRWTSKSQTGQKTGFRNLPIDFKALAGKTNKKIVSIRLSMAFPTSTLNHLQLIFAHPQ